MRAALQHLAARGRTDEGLVAAAPLGPFWFCRGPLGEGREWIHEFRQSDTGPLRVRAIAEG